METILQYMQSYYCICPPKQVPLCGFGSFHSALRHKVDHGMEGEIQRFDTATMEYEYLCQGCGRPESQCSADPCAAVQRDRAEVL